MKIPTMLLLLLTTIGFAQSGTQKEFAIFKQNLDDYLVKSQGVKQAACAEYTLKYVVKADSGKEAVFPMNSKTLCDDLKKFESSQSKDPNWSYDLKPVGDKYYIIRGDKKGGDGLQIYYYYEHK